MGGGRVTYCRLVPNPRGGGLMLIMMICQTIQITHRKVCFII